MTMSTVQLIAMSTAWEEIHHKVTHDPQPSDANLNDTTDAISWHIMGSPSHIPSLEKHQILNKADLIDNNRGTKFHVLLPSPLSLCQFLDFKPFGTGICLLFYTTDAE